jgi:hypothetical protein
MVTKYDILDMYNVFTNIKHQSHNLRLDLMSFFLNTKSKNEKKTNKKMHIGHRQIYFSYSLFSLFQFVLYKMEKV